MLVIDKIIALRDNYVYFIRDYDTGLVAVVDPSEPDAVISYCADNKISPNFVLNTHHHWDHVGGNLAIKQVFGAQIAGYVGDGHRIPGIDILLDEGDVFALGASKLSVMYVPGHTTGHIVYYSEIDSVVFTGDTLFSMGCGGNFEGTYRDLYNSLLRIMTLPDKTKVYCGHEYTKLGLRFARKMEGDTEALMSRAHEVANGDTVPSTIGKEKATNTFLRFHSAAIRERLGLGADTSDFEVFCAIRSS